MKDAHKKRIAKQEARRERERRESSEAEQLLRKERELCVVRKEKERKLGRERAKEKSERELDGLCACPPMILLLLLWSVFGCRGGCAGAVLP